MANLFDPPPRKTLPLTKSRDVVVDFKQKIDGVYTNYAAGVTVNLIIDTIPTQTTAVATINTFHAVCKLESTVTDGIPAAHLGDASSHFQLCRQRTMFRCAAAHQEQTSDSPILE